MANVARIAREFERGTTLVVQGMHHWWQPLAKFCRTLEAELGHPAQANAYFTPRAAQGLPVHHDTHDVFCLQLSGEKRWLVYEPVLELPLRDQKYDSSLGAPGEPVLDVLLRAGDTLYLPRGWLHAATTSDDESLHLTIGVNVYTWLDAFRAALDDCGDDVAFRRAAQAGDPQPLLEALGERLCAEDVERRRRAKLVRSRRPILDGQVAALRALESLDLETELERRPTVLALLDGAQLLVEGTALEFPEHVRDDLDFVLSTEGSFRPSDLPGNLDGEGRLALVRRLVREGVIRPVR
jgi:hypothetical protein